MIKAVVTITAKDKPELDKRTREASDLLFFRKKFYKIEEMREEGIKISIKKVTLKNIL